MRVLVALLLLSAAAPLAIPTAGACHPDPAGPAGQPLDGWYVIPGVWYGGCPHELTFCFETWREDNGEPGLQRAGNDPDQYFVIVCPFP